MITRRRVGRREGFTLIEVLMAMVLLGIGLMMMGPLAISAIRTVGLADRNSRAAVTATQYLEDALVQLRAGALPGECVDKVLSNGDKVTRTVATSAVVGTWVSRVTVEVTPAPGGLTPLPFTIASNVFHSVEKPTAAGRPCP